MMVLDLDVADHAIDRYIERVEDLDCNRECYEHIIKAQIDEYVGLDGSYPMGNGICAVIRDNTIVTVKNRKNRVEPIKFQGLKRSGVSNDNSV